MATGDPEDALTESGDETLVAFDVTPGAADRRVPGGFNEWRNRFEARLSEPARDGRANAELTDAVSDLADAPARLARGASSSKKTVAVAAPPDRVLAAFLAAIED
ncbi:MULTISPECIES: DUF167 domain-containing protein [Halorussus]|uniref:DUF167 domain-containing protein n=1 Tax=Halorussus TaxID=1070314 RepID=UPI000E211188|nr:MULTISPECIES: DUF167 family protein [Halorussus]NHN58488.1 hypothetical protein [Halorussus sp. JP-T4]